MALPAIESNGTSQDTEALYREHGPAVARFCRSLLRDPSEAEDAAQQVFLSAHRALLNGSAPREPLAWLLAVARNECYARFRQRATSPLPVGEVPEIPTPDSAVHALRAGELATVWDEVARMPTTQREAFLLREIRGLDYSQLAAELSLSAPSVRSLLVRARTRLRHRLRDVTASLGGAQWIQSLVRLVGGGDGASPVPAATKAAAVGMGALALAGGGDLARTPHHAAKTVRHAATRPHTHARPGGAATSVAAPVATSDDRSLRDVRRSEPEHSQRRGDGSRRSGSGSAGSRSRDSGGELGTPASDGSSESGHDGSDDSAALAQPTTDGRDGESGGGSTSSGSGREGSGQSSSGGSPSDGGSSGSGSGSDDGSGSTTTTTSSGSGPDGGSSGGDGGVSGSGSDGGGSSGPGG